MEAENGEDAVEKFMANRDIKLILLDVMMPKMDRWETLRIIRENSNVPIIMLTTSEKEMNCRDFLWE